MITEQKIREIFEIQMGKRLCLDKDPDGLALGEIQYKYSHVQAQFIGYRDGYMALLNALEPCAEIKEPYTMGQLYRLPKGVEKV